MLVVLDDLHWADQATAIQCAVAHYLGMLDHILGRYDDAERWFEEAMTIHTGLESPLLADRNRGDDPERARTMAERAVTVATAGSYVYIRSDAEGVLARLS